MFHAYQFAGASCQPHGTRPGTVLEDFRIWLIAEKLVDRYNGRQRQERDMTVTGKSAAVSKKSAEEAVLQVMRGNEGDGQPSWFFLRTRVFG
jgi:hypothetical protein